jgi:hypothetical protein
VVPGPGRLSNPSDAGLAARRQFSILDHPQRSLDKVVQVGRIESLYCGEGDRVGQAIGPVHYRREQELLLPRLCLRQVREEWQILLRDSAERTKEGVHAHIPCHGPNLHIWTQVLAHRHGDVAAA